MLYVLIWKEVVFLTVILCSLYYYNEAVMQHGILQILFPLLHMN